MPILASGCTPRLTFLSSLVNNIILLYARFVCILVFSPDTLAFITNGVVFDSSADGRVAPEEQQAGGGGGGDEVEGERVLTR